MKAMFKLISPLLLVIAIAGCGTLDPSGPYQGDKVLYDADMVLSVTYEAIDSFLVWEMNHRGTSVCPADVTAAADKIRDDAPKAFSTALACRDTYFKTKAKSDQDALTRSLFAIRQLLSIASTYIPAQSATL